jgi:pyruvate ferredoxin oxidoreductase alpha subunit
MKAALGVFKEVEKEFHSLSGRKYGAVDAYNTDQADRIVVINGCASGTMRAAARVANKAGDNVGVLAIKLFRPFPTDEVVDNLRDAESVVVMDRSMSPGAPSGPLAEDVKSALKSAGLDPPVMSLVYGIGGRDFALEDGRKVFSMAKDKGSYGATSFMYGVKN